MNTWDQEKVQTVCLDFFLQLSVTHVSQCWRTAFMAENRGRGHSQDLMQKFGCGNRFTLYSLLRLADEASSMHEESCIQVSRKEAESRTGSKCHGIFAATLLHCLTCWCSRDFTWWKISGRNPEQMMQTFAFANATTPEHLYDISGLQCMCENSFTN